MLLMNENAFRKFKTPASKRWQKFLNPTQMNLHIQRQLPYLGFIFSCSYFTFPPKFALASPPWGQAQPSWNFNTVCRRVTVRNSSSITFFGNLTYFTLVLGHQTFHARCVASTLSRHNQYLCGSVGADVWFYRAGILASSTQTKFPFTRNCIIWFCT